MVLENFIVDAPIVWDRVGKKIFENPHVKQGRKMRVQITNAGMVEDLSGYTLALGWKHTVSGVDGLDVFEDSSEANVGIFEMAYTENLMTNLGNLKASLVLTSVEDMVVVESNDFYVKVDDSPFGADAEQGVGSYTRLAEILLNEESRIAAEVARVSAEETRVTDFNALVDSEIIAQNVATKLQAKEAEYLPRLVSTEQQLAEAATKVELNAVASGSPKGVYATLSALQSAKPTGDANIYLVTADGKWYYWSGSAWTAGGTYQSTGIADGSVTYNKFQPSVKEVIDKVSPIEIELNGVGVLPNNKNTGEGTSAPHLLATSTETDHFPGVRLVVDTDSPMAGKYTYKHQIFKATATTGWQSIIKSAPTLNKNVTGISLGFWVKDTDIKSIFSTSRKIGFNFYSASGEMKVSYDIYSLIEADNNTVTPTKSTSTGMISSWNVSAMCLNKSSGYSFVRIDFTDIVWNEAFSNFSSIVTHFVLDNVYSQLYGKEINIAGMTLLYNSIIENGLYVHPDSISVSQYPNASSVSDRIDDLNTLKIKPVQLIINKGNVEDTYITTNYDDAYTLKQTLNVFYGDTNNSTVMPIGQYLIPKSPGTTITLVKNEDDGCPISYNDSYMGAGHGFYGAKNVKLPSHGKTYADIGSEWVDVVGVKFYIINIVDADNLMVLGEDLSNNDIYDIATTLTGTTLTHIAGAINTATMSGFTASNTYVNPSVTNHTKKVLVDGKSIVDVDGAYYGDFIDVVDTYDITNPSEIAGYLIANKPVGGYTQNPPLNVGSTVVRMSNVYRFLSDGTMLIISDVNTDVDINLSFWGITQVAMKAGFKQFGGTIKKYVPKSLQQTINSKVYDYRTPTDVSGTIDTINFTQPYWETLNSPPDRMMDLFTDNTGDIKAGFAYGYLPVGGALDRKDNIDNAMMLYNTKKAYFHFVDSKTPLPAYSSMQGIVYRKCYPINNVNKTSFYSVPYGQKLYVYVDYHKVVDDNIEIPPDYVGLPLTIVEKSSNVTVYGTLAQEKVRIRVAGSTPMYGYAVLLIG